jgi:DNA-binding MarR family transcriptional regulator
MTTQFANKFDWIRAISDPNSGLTSTQHHVALALSQHLNLTGSGFATHAQLALDTRMSERTVCAALTELADMHWIERTPGRVGRATDYVIARKFGWETTPKAEIPKRPRRKKRSRQGSADNSAARRFLAGIYTDTGIDPTLAEADTEATGRLIGALRRQMNSLESDQQGLQKIREVLVETSLESAHDPAAVLLNRYKKALRTYPHLRPVAKNNAETSVAVEDMIAQVAQVLSQTPDSRRLHTDSWNRSLAR